MASVEQRSSRARQTLTAVPVESEMRAQEEAQVRVLEEDEEVPPASAVREAEPRLRTPLHA